MNIKSSEPLTWRLRAWREGIEGENLPTERRLVFKPLKWYMRVA